MCRGGSKFRPACAVAILVASSAQALTVPLNQRRHILAGAAAGLCVPFVGAVAAHADDVASPNAPAQFVPGVGGTVPLQPVIIDGDSVPWSPQRLTTKTGQLRIVASELSPLNPSLVPFAKDNELFYPPFLFGEWQATAKLCRKVFPYGIGYAPSKSLIEGSPRYRMESVGDSTSYLVRFYSPDVPENQDITKIDLAKSKIIADRRFNALSTSAAYKQLTPVQEVTWDPVKDPTRLTLSFGAGPLTDDMRPLGPRRSEVYVTARKREEGTDKMLGMPTFAAAERTRQVTLAPGNVIVADTETTTEYQVVSPDPGEKEGSHVQAVSRIAVYLTPNPNSREGVLWQQVGGKAVAFYDYEIDMRRRENSDGDIGPCVTTPKGNAQCA